MKTSNVAMAACIVLLTGSVLTGQLNDPRKGIAKVIAVKAAAGKDLPPEVKAPRTRA